MIKIEFSEEIIEQLNYERYHNPHPHVRRKMNVLYQKGKGMSHKEIKNVEGICENTLLKYLREYQQGGIERLKEIHFYAPKSELEPYSEKLKAYFLEHPPATINEAIAKIEEITGIKRKREQVRVFLRKLGLKPHKVGMVPAKADVEIQEKFIVEQLTPRIDEARTGNRALFFGCLALCPSSFLGIFMVIQASVYQSPIRTAEI